MARSEYGVGVLFIRNAVNFGLLEDPKVVDLHNGMAAIEAT